MALCSFATWAMYFVYFFAHLSCTEAETYLMENCNDWFTSTGNCSVQTQEGALGAASINSVWIRDGTLDLGLKTWCPFMNNSCPTGFSYIGWMKFRDYPCEEYGVVISTGQFNVHWVNNGHLRVYSWMINDTEWFIETEQPVVLNVWFPLHIQFYYNQTSQKGSLELWLQYQLQASTNTSRKRTYMPPVLNSLFGGNGMKAHNASIQMDRTGFFNTATDFLSLYTFITDMGTRVAQCSWRAGVMTRQYTCFWLERSWPRNWTDAYADCNRTAFACGYPYGRLARIPNYNVSVWSALTTQLATYGNGSNGYNAWLGGGNQLNYTSIKMESIVPATIPNGVVGNASKNPNDCMQLDTKTKPWQWSEALCNKTQHYVCEMSFDCLLNNPCQNKGHCQPVNSGTMCRCWPGTSGQFCEIGSPQPAFVEIRTCPGATTTSTSQATTTTTQTTTTIPQTTTTTNRPATAVASVTPEPNTQASSTSTTAQPATTYKALVDAPSNGSCHSCFALVLVLLKKQYELKHRLKMLLFKLNFDLETADAWQCYVHGQLDQLRANNTENEVFGQFKDADCNHFIDLFIRSQLNSRVLKKFTRVIVERATDDDQISLAYNKDVQTSDLWEDLLDTEKTMNADPCFLAIVQNIKSQAAFNKYLQIGEENEQDDQTWFEISKRSVSFGHSFISNQNNPSCKVHTSKGQYSHHSNNAGGRIKNEKMSSVEEPMNSAKPNNGQSRNGEKKGRSSRSSGKAEVQVSNDGKNNPKTSNAGRKDVHSTSEAARNLQSSGSGKKDGDSTSEVERRKHINSGGSSDHSAGSSGEEHMNSGVRRNGQYNQKKNMKNESSWSSGADGQASNDEKKEGKSSNAGKKHVHSTSEAT